MNLRGVLALSVALALAVPAQAEEVSPPTKQMPASAEQWREAARTDILAAYDIFVRNHPGMYDLANPDFPEQLSKARSAGLAAAADARDELGYRRALAAFSGVLQDGHALAYVPGSDGVGKPEWPGFVALWRGGALYARTHDEADPLDGARITSCDGMPIEDFLRRALATRYFRPDELGQWWYRPSQLFFARSGRTGDEPDRCSFTLRTGTSETRTLDWRALDAEDSSFGSKLIFGDEVPTEIAEPRDGIFLIGLQDFQPDEAGMAAYRLLYDDVRARREELKNARAVVLDLRHNNGGSSEWSYQFAEALWGKDAFAAREQGSEEVDWRASKDNTAYVASLADEFHRTGREDYAKMVGDIASGMTASLKRGEAFYVERDDDNPDEAGGAPVSESESDFTTPVYVITWGGCGSACLDAIDYFKRFPNTKLIGAPTGADSTYMDVRTEDLPAGPGAIVIPNKVYVGRPRGWGEFYEPDIPMTALEWSTSAFLDLVEQDLAAR